MVTLNRRGHSEKSALMRESIIMSTADSDTERRERERKKRRRGQPLGNTSRNRQVLSLSFLSAERLEYL